MGVKRTETDRLTHNEKCFQELKVAHIRECNTWSLLVLMSTESLRGDTKAHCPIGPEKRNALIRRFSNTLSLHESSLRHH